MTTKASRPRTDSERYVELASRRAGNQTGAVSFIVLMIMSFVVVLCGVLAYGIQHQNDNLRQDNIAAVTALGFIAQGESTAREIATRNGSNIVAVREWPTTNDIAQQVTIATQSADHEHLGVATARSVWLAHDDDTLRLEFCCD